MKKYLIHPRKKLSITLRLLTSFKFLSIALINAISFTGYSQPTSIDTSIKKINTSLTVKGALPKSIREASGLEITAQKKFWTHNDDGIPVLFCIDSTGHVVKTLHLNHPNKGWEDLAIDDNNNLYVGAIGNNNNDKKSFKIYRFKNIDSLEGNIINGDIIEFTLADQRTFPPVAAARNFDMDAFIFFHDSLFIFTKNRTEPFTGYTKIYKLPAHPGNYSLLPYDSIYLGEGPMLQYQVTGADISDDKTLALLSHDKLWLIKDFSGSKFSSGKIIQLNVNHFSHKAGISFYSNEIIFIVDELEMGFIGGKIYKLDLKNIKQ